MHVQTPPAVAAPRDAAPSPDDGPAVSPDAPEAAPRGVRVTAWAVLVLCLVAGLATAVLDALTPAAARAAVAQDPGWLIGLPGILLAVPAYLLLRRAHRNATSWVLAGTAVMWAVDGLAGSWLAWALRSDPPLPAASLSFWLVQRAGAWLLLGLPLLLLVYPEGRLPGGRWRLLSWLSLACTSLLPLLLLVVPSEIADQRAGSTLPAVYDRIDVDPTSLPLPADVVLPLLRFAFPAALLGVLVPLVVVVRRHRRSAGERRRQLRWLLWAGVVDALVMFAALLAPGSTASLALSVAVALTGGAVTVGILRPRAVDIDRLLARTLVYGGLAVAVVLLDLGVVAATGALLGDRLGQRDVALLALLVVTALYVPLRAQLWRGVRRWVLGKREDPYRVVSALAERLERSEDPGGQLLAVAGAVAEAFRSPYVGVEVDHAGGDLLVAEHGGRPAAVQALPITYRGEEVGRLLLPRDGVRASLLTDERLLADVVRQAAAAARASSLAAELQRSREGLVAAREEERRRLRRDLHDGLGPSLGAVVLRIDTARNLARTRPEEADAVLRQARDDVAAALADVRRLVHDLRPPALDDLGLVGAVRQQAERLLAPRVAVEVVADAAVDELPAAVEVAAYRIASEALANVARHARATSCTVELARDDGWLVVGVTDDGVGIDPGAPAGVGLVSLRERAAELGGRCSVSCPDDGGTVVRALLPVDGRRTGG